MTVSPNTAATAAPQPWLGYDDQEVATIRGYLTKSCSAQANAVLAYEHARLDRALIIAAADARLAKLPH